MSDYVASEEGEILPDYVCVQSDATFLQLIDACELVVKRDIKIMWFAANEQHLAAEIALFLHDCATHVAGAPPRLSARRRALRFIAWKYNLGEPIDPRWQEPMDEHDYVSTVGFMLAMMISRRRQERDKST